LPLSFWVESCDGEKMDIIYPQEDLEDIAKEFEERDLFSFYTECEEKLSMYTGAMIHKVKNFRHALEGNLYWSKEINVRTFRELREESEKVHLSNIKTIYFMRRYLNMSI
jgi:hypothetical protein